MEKLQKSEKNTRDRKDSGFTDSVIFSSEEREAEPDILEEEKSLTARQYRVFVEEVNHDGPRQFILEDTSTKSHRRGVFFSDEIIDETKELFFQQETILNPDQQTFETKKMNKAELRAEDTLVDTGATEEDEERIETEIELRFGAEESQGLTRGVSPCDAESDLEMKKRSCEASIINSRNRPTSGVSDNINVFYHQSSHTPLMHNDPERNILRCSTKMKICGTVVGFLVVAVALCIVSFGPATNDVIAKIQKKSDFSAECSSMCSDILKTASVSNGKLECSDDKLYVSCETHFELIGKDSVGCNTTNVDLFGCTPKRCHPPPQPLDGTVVCKKSLNIGDSCAVTCRHGLAEGEQDQVTCQEDLTWSRLPSCLPPPCTSWNNSQDKILCSDSGQHCMARCGQGRVTQVSSCSYS